MSEVVTETESLAGMESSNPTCNLLFELLEELCTPGYTSAYPEGPFLEFDDLHWTSSGVDKLNGTAGWKVANPITSPSQAADQHLAQQHPSQDHQPVFWLQLEHFLRE